MRFALLASAAATTCIVLLFYLQLGYRQPQVVVVTEAEQTSKAKLYFEEGEAASYNDVLTRMRYWEVSASVSRIVPSEHASYLLMDHDCGGFNNARQAYELAVIIAHMTERTLVLPPPSHVYLLGGTMDDVMNVSALAAGLSSLGTLDFVRREGEPLAIPARFDREGKWMGEEAMRTEWKAWRSALGGDLPWGSLVTYLAWPSRAAVDALLSSGDAPTRDRVLAYIDGRQPVEYTSELRARRVLNLPSCRRFGIPKGQPVELYRWLGQSAMYVVDASSPASPHTNNNRQQPAVLQLPAPQPVFSVLQLLRDHVRYVDRVWELAARAVAHLGPFSYYSAHIRRGDFQYTQTRTNSAASLKNVRSLLVAGKTVYIATDDKSKAFFGPWRAKFTVVRWRDLVAPSGPLAGVEVPLRLVGLVEQAICAMGRRFIGTQFSTFSSYIVRLRGFVGAPDLRTYYHTQAYRTGDAREIEHKQPRYHGNGYMFEWPALWAALPPPSHLQHLAAIYLQPSSVATANKTLRFVWSTDCSARLHWQSVALLHSARLVGQRGAFTRLVSGCSTQAQRDAMLRIRPHLGLATYFMPAQASSRGAKQYAQKNRPEVLVVWLGQCYQSSCDRSCPGGCVRDSEVLVVIDPDMAFMKPLTQTLEAEQSAALQLWKHDMILAAPGRPVAQGYGIGPFSRHVDLCVKFFGGVDASEGCQQWAKSSEGWRHWSIGAPYILYPADMLRIAPLWSQLTAVAFDKMHGIESDMYAYAMAAAHLGIVHSRVENLGISSVRSEPWHVNAPWSVAAKEGWEHVDRAFLENSAPKAREHPCRCHTPVHSADARAALPTFLHYCQSWKAYGGTPHGREVVGFSKYLVPDDILACDSPLLAEPWAPRPVDMDVLRTDARGAMEVTYFDEHGRLRPEALESRREPRRDAFIMCQAILTLNAALLDHKRAFCPAGFNANRTLILPALRSSVEKIP